MLGKLLYLFTVVNVVTTEYLMCILGIKYIDLLSWSFMFPCSGKVFREFVPVDKILKPVLLECVTPVTCYWSLSLIIRGEEELKSVFKVLNLFSSFKRC